MATPKEVVEAMLKELYDQAEKSEKLSYKELFTDEARKRWREPHRLIYHWHVPESPDHPIPERGDSMSLDPIIEELTAKAEKARVFMSREWEKWMRDNPPEPVLNPWDKFFSERRTIPHDQLEPGYYWAMDSRGGGDAFVVELSDSAGGDLWAYPTGSEMDIPIALLVFIQRIEPPTLTKEQ